MTVIELKHNPKMQWWLGDAYTYFEGFTINGADDHSLAFFPQESVEAIYTQQLAEYDNQTRFWEWDEDTLILSEGKIKNPITVSRPDGSKVKVYALEGHWVIVK